MSVRAFRRAHARRVEREGRRASLLARRGRLLAGATLGATALLTTTAQAANYTVTSLMDDAPGGTCTAGSCNTLRDALSVANADSSADTITFQSGLTGPLTLSNGALPLNNQNGITIQGPGASAITIDGNNASQVFSVNRGEANLSSMDSIDGLTITHGSSGSSPGGAIGMTTGHSFAIGLTLSGDVISNSSSTASGGGVFAEGPLTVTGTTVSGNTAPTGGGIVDELSTGKYFNANSESNALLTITGGSIISGNTATSTNFLDGGGGVALEGAPGVITDSTVSGNTSSVNGGGVSSFSKYGLTMSGSKITGNSAPSGGGIELVGFPEGQKYAPTDISTSTISGNHGNDGAGIGVAEYKEATNSPEIGEPITISRSTISGNSGGSGSFGGGLSVDPGLGSPFRLVNSTISGNTATTGGGISLGDGYDAPLFATDPNTARRGSVSLENSTIAGNSATASGGGGGVYLGDYTSGSSKTSANAALNSTIVSGNTAAGSASDLARASGSTGGGFNGAFSLVQTPGSAPLTGNQLITGKDPKLGPLANNGGTTQTMLPAGNSPVIDQGHAPLGEQVDQIGNPRTVDNPAFTKPPGGDSTDIGAVELTTGQVIQPPGPPALGFAATIRGKLIGGGTTPVLAGSQTQVTCSVKTGLLGSCSVEVKVAGEVVATGGVSATSNTNQLTLKVHAGRLVRRALLKKYPLGVDATAYVVGSASGPAQLNGPVHLFGSPFIKLALDDKHLSSKLNRVAKALAGVSEVHCYAYLASGGASAAKTAAQSACKQLANAGLKASFKSFGVDHGAPSSPVNRLTIWFKF